MKTLGFACAFTVLTTLTGCPDETSSGGGGSGGEGGSGAEGGDGGTGGTGGGMGGQAAFDAAVQENCDVQCACGCTEEEAANCIDVTSGNNAPDDPSCNDEYVVYLDCLTENWDCAKNPLEIIMVSCASEYDAQDDCDDAP